MINILYLMTFFFRNEYLISGFRWSFFDLADVPVGVSLFAVALFLLAGLFAVWAIFRTGWRLRS